MSRTYSEKWFIEGMEKTLEFLTKEYYEHYRELVNYLPTSNNYEFRGSIVEGNYYEIPTRFFESGSIPEILTSTYHAILAENLMSSPFKDTMDKDDILDIEEGIETLNVKPHKNERQEMFVYCFNVGQGDSFLIIFPNNNVYIIDTNIYAGNKLDRYVCIVKYILSNNNLSINKVKALIITHRHLDHLRGAGRLVRSKEFIIDNFIINFDYKHETNVVFDLLNAANHEIGHRINVNMPFSFNEGKVKVMIINPKADTFNNTVCNDVNDSSIVLLLQYGDSNVILSGDASYKVVTSYFSRQLTGENFLKVSHHGSRTGTNEHLLKRLQPMHLFQQVIIKLLIILIVRLPMY